MSDKTPVVIEIVDVGDKRACVAAIRKLHAALKEHYGEREARNIFYQYQDLRSPEWQTRLRFDQACYSFSDQELRLILEYYAVPKPNKEKLARDLAKKNETLPVRERYQVDSAEDPAAAILQQIKRAYRWDKEAWHIIGEAPDGLRQEKLEHITRMCHWHNLSRQNKKRLPRMPRTTLRQRLGERYGRISNAWSRRREQGSP